MSASVSAGQPASPSANPGAALRGATLAFAKKQQQQPTPSGFSAPGVPGPRSRSGSPARPGPAVRDNGALLAATSATRGLSPARQPRRFDHPGAGTNAAVAPAPRGSSRGPDQRHAVPPTDNGTRAGRSDVHLPLPNGNHTPSPAHAAVDPWRASFIAATLAASRSASPAASPAHTGSDPQGLGLGMHPAGTQLHSKSSLGAPSYGLIAATAASRHEAKQLELEPMPATTSLISMFEGKKHADMDPVKKQTLSTPKAPRIHPQPASTELLSAGGARSRTTPTNYVRDISLKTAPNPRRPSPARSLGSRAPMLGLSVPSSAPSLALESNSFSGSAVRMRTSPPATGHVAGQPRSAQLPPSRGDVLIPERHSELTYPFHQRLNRLQGTVSTPSTPMGVRPGSSASTSSDDTFVSASSGYSSASEPPLGRIEPARTPPPQRTRPPVSAGSSSLTLVTDAYTPARLASNLAATMHPLQPSYTGPPSPTPSSTRLRPTLRRPTHGSDDEHHHHHHHHHNHRHSHKHHSSKRDRSNSRHGRRRLGGKRHAHHEGARRRWRDEITPAERRRYEAVWASNRGLLLVDEATGRPAPGALVGGGLPGLGQRSADNDADDQVAGHLRDMVCGLVVRDIWSRSRLPADELAEMWELVDGGPVVRGREGGGWSEWKGKGVLGKAEFVVGMWLIDQRLKGRKIPHRVSESVWDSVVKGGVSVKSPRTKGKHKL